MDVVDIRSKFMTGIIAKLIKNGLKKKIGYDVDIELDKITFDRVNGTVHFATEIDLTMANTDFEKLIKDLVFKEGTHD